jgi:hypothetical protein
MKWKSKEENVKFIAIAMLVQRSSIAAVGELTNCPPGTEAKLIHLS